MKWFLLIILLSSVAFAECIFPMSGLTIDKNTEVCNGVYDVPGGLIINTSNVLLNCNGAIFRGTKGRSEVGLRVEKAENVTVKNCQILTFNQGLFLKEVKHSLFEGNSLLKNRIGVRLLDSFENRIQRHADQSFEVPVSSINSKFNIVLLDNRRLDKEFCKVNVCNKERNMSVCNDDDFYCSINCSYESDNDCPAPKKEFVKEKKEISVKISEVVQKVVPEKVTTTVKEEPVEEAKNKLSVLLKLLIYISLYLCIFFIFYQLKKR
ncbi:hypothetical protein COV18_07590 [Candidatus Woesearchaeota archaeon CG10_big_fil_rev_8_21_14_0_10_37_12]|nr:MAG: hypothetical protein COV18_07590 [Candidatus Woesearchaeota archaeon CG10_big_fil_rev_8_21_14_0_10_37_12]